MAMSMMMTMLVVTIHDDTKVNENTDDLMRRSSPTMTAGDLLSFQSSADPHSSTDTLINDDSCDDHEQMICQTETTIAKGHFRKKDQLASFEMINPYLAHHFHC